MNGLWIFFIFLWPSTGLCDLVQDLIQLQDQLPQAVCDQSLVSRPPFLKFPDTEKSILMSHEQGFYVLENPLSFSEVLQVLLLKEVSALSASGIQKERAHKRDESLESFKQKISQEFCMALLSLEKKESFFKDKKNWFLELSEKKPENEKRAFLVEDSEGRFLRQKNHFLVGGWIEPYEVLAFQDQGGFEIKKMIHPLTRETQSIVLLGRYSEPLGFFQMKVRTPDSSKRTLSAVEGQYSKELLLRKRLDLYQMLIESEAYRALFQLDAKKEGHLDQKKEKIKKTKEFYLNLVQAFHIFPENPQFHPYSGTLVSLDQKSVEEYIKKNELMAQVEMDFQLLPRDEKLLGIFNEYLKQVKKISISN